MPQPMRRAPTPPEQFAEEIITMASMVYVSGSGPANLNLIRSLLVAAIQARDFSLTTSTSNALGGSSSEYTEKVPA